MNDNTNDVDPVALRAIFFDLGNVLLDFDWARAIPRFAEYNGGDEQRILDFLRDPVHVKFEEGRVTPQQFYDDFVSRTGVKVSYEVFGAIWSDIFVEIETTTELLGELSHRYALYLVSNTNALHVEHVEARYDFFKIFQKRFYSQELKLRKPDPQVYHVMLEQARVTVPQALLVDDRPENIASARAIGMQTFLASSPQATRAELEKLLLKAEVR